MPFCDICGRRLEPDATFCDQCGRKVAVGEAAPVTHLGPVGPRLSRAPGEPEPAESPAMIQPRMEPPSIVPRRRFHITRRALALSVAAAAVIGIVALALLTGTTVLPPLPGTSAQTSTQTSSTVVTTQATGPKLQVKVDITKNPVNPGSTQVIVVTVRDPNGSPVPSASVAVEVTYPLGQKVASQGLTGGSGQYVYAVYITASTDSLGTFNVAVSATKDGYQPTQAQATFEAVQA